MSTPTQKPGRSKQDYATPRAFIDAVVRRFGPLAVDLAATRENVVTPYYYSAADNSLLQDWTILRGNLWLNPPFADIGPWARKCAESRDPDCVRRILLLVPASVGSEWFAQWVHRHALVIGIRPRLSFDGINPYPKDCILCVYGETPGFDTWRWDCG